MLTITQMLTDDEKEGKAYVHWKAWTEAYSHLLPEHFCQEYTVERCRKWAFDYPNDVFVAKIEDKIVGFVCCAASLQEDLKGTGEIYAIYILEEYYGRQIGYRLMQFALEQLKDFPQVVLWVLDGNERAICFYERVGFRFDGATKIVHLGKEMLEKRMVYQR
ncbi:GNAT family N-acetyltransferase [Streptococcus respiraculi]|uniref:GNAT family N-acetyltransferase n=1 Tax=Streptococcus respiraculi TaxID=2021971 RepID=UPI001F0C91EC|nr:GNAT family N-acetyltransferase [Streptococcus respiraculi]